MSTPKPQPKPENPRVLAVLGVLVVIVLGYLFVVDPDCHRSGRSSNGGVPSTNPGPDADDAIGAWIAATDYIQTKLASPGSAKFPGLPPDDAISTLGPERWRIHSYVDSQNALGALLRSDWSVEVDHTDPSKWKFSNVIITNSTTGEIDVQ